MSIGGSVWTICNSRSSSKTPTLRRDRGVGQVETPLVGNVEGNDRVTDVSLFHTGANPLDGSGAKRIRDGVPSQDRRDEGHDTSSSETTYGTNPFANGCVGTQTDSFERSGCRSDESYGHSGVSMVQEKETTPRKSGL